MEWNAACTNLSHAKIKFIPKCVELRALLMYGIVPFGRRQGEMNSMRNAVRVYTLESRVTLTRTYNTLHTKRPDAIRFIVLQPKASIESWMAPSNPISSAEKKTMCGNWY